MKESIAYEDDEITVPAFQFWLKRAKAGDSFVYHRGMLVSDREEISMIPGVGLVHVYNEPINTLATLAWEEHLKGSVTLGQRKLTNGRGYEYIAFKRSTRRQ